MTTNKRALTALATGALTLPFLWAPPAFAAAPDPPPNQSVDAVCANVPDDYDPFVDDEPNTFTDVIECVAYAGIALGGPGGLPSDQYGPGLTVQRGQMAAFIARLMDTAADLDTGSNIQPLPAYDGSTAFTDVPEGSTHVEAINRLEAVGVVQGGPGGRPPSQYGPELPVTRAQMATFINRAVAFLQGGDPAQAGRTSGYRTTADYFTDDESFQAHEHNINGIASEGIAVGDGVDTYNPGASIKRDQMAAFLARTLAVLHEAGDIRPVEAAQSGGITVTPDTEADRVAVPNPDTTTADDRTYTASGLVAGQEYRITLVVEGNVTRNADGEQVFAEDGTTGLAATGTRTADITSVDGQAAQNNTGDGTTRTNVDSTNGGSVVFTAPADGSVTFVVDGDQGGESVLPVVYRNGGTGNTDEDGGQNARLELNDDGTAAEEYDTGGVTNFTSAADAPVTTAAPDLVSAEFVRNTGTGDAQTTTVRYTFDEPVVAAVTETAFHLYRFDGTQVNPRVTSGADAQRDPADERSVLVVFDLTAAEFAEITLATVDAGAVEDVDGNSNPIGDDAIGSGVTFTAGRTAAPDLVSLSNVQDEGTGQDRVVTVDFTFDEPVFVVDPTPGQFQLILTDAAAEAERQQDGAPVPVTDGGFVGEGTNTLTVQFADPQGVITTLQSIARGVVLEGTVSDTEQETSTLPLPPDTPEGNLNPLQVSNTPRTATNLPELSSVTVNPGAGTVTYVFDEPVSGADPTDFRVYDASGEESTGGQVVDQNATDATVVVSFAGDVLDDVVGASVAGGAVTETSPQTTGGETRANQEDELPVSSPSIAAGRTTGPDLLRVEREAQEVSTTDPFTGEVTTEVTGVVVRFVFDDEATTDGEGFFVVGADGTSTALTGCTQAADDPQRTDEQNTVECEVPAEDDPFTPLTDESAAFEPAMDAVGGAVDDGAVTDDEGTTNPEGISGIAEV